MMRYPGSLLFYMCAGQLSSQSQAQWGGRDRHGGTANTVVLNTGFQQSCCQQGSQSVTGWYRWLGAAVGCLVLSLETIAAQMLTADRSAWLSAAWHSRQSCAQKHHSSGKPQLATSTQVTQSSAAAAAAAVTPVQPGRPAPSQSVIWGCKQSASRQSSNHCYHRQGQCIQGK